MLDRLVDVDVTADSLDVLDSSLLTVIRHADHRPDNGNPDEDAQHHHPDRYTTASSRLCGIAHAAKHGGFPDVS